MQSPGKKTVDFLGTERSSAKYADPKNAAELKKERW
jgi:hypothetical protein